MANSNQSNQGSKGKNDAQGNQTDQGKQGNQTGQSQQSDSSNRGFASMDPERQREIAAEGGRAAHASGNTHEFTSEEARQAGSQSHRNDGNQQSGSSNDGNQQSGSSNDSSRSSQGNANSADTTTSGNTRGGTPEQHAAAGRQSHKNDR